MLLEAGKEKIGMKARTWLGGQFPRLRDWIGTPWILPMVGMGLVIVGIVLAISMEMCRVVN